MMHITANELKSQGVPAIESALEGSTSVMILVRGKARYVVIEQEHYWTHCPKSILFNFPKNAADDRCEFECCTDISDESKKL